MSKYKSVSDTLKKCGDCNDYVPYDDHVGMCKLDRHSVYASTTGTFMFKCFKEKIDDKLTKEA